MRPDAKPAYPLGYRLYIYILSSLSYLHTLLVYIVIFGDLIINFVRMYGGRAERPERPDILAKPRTVRVCGLCPEGRARTVEGRKLPFPSCKGSVKGLN